MLKAAIFQTCRFRQWLPLLCPSLRSIYLSRYLRALYQDEFCFFFLRSSTSLCSRLALNVCRRRRGLRSHEAQCFNCRGFYWEYFPVGRSIKLTTKWTVLRGFRRAPIDFVSAQKYVEWAKLHSSNSAHVEVSSSGVVSSRFKTSCYWANYSIPLYDYYFVRLNKYAYKNAIKMENDKWPIIFVRIFSPKLRCFHCVVLWKSTYMETQPRTS